MRLLGLCSVLIMFGCGGGGTHPILHLDGGAGDLASGCMNGQQKCNNFCTNTATDPNNCGNCGNVCMQGMSCVNSQCMMGGCMNGQMNCSGTCTNTATDPNNCGGCGHVCMQGMSCVGSQCTGGGAMTGCNGFIGCANNCADSPCVQTCFMNTTMKGQQLAQALLGCLEQACPSMNGGVCDPKANMMQACATCYMNAQAMNGACYTQLMACNNDMP